MLGIVLNPLTVCWHCKQFRDSDIEVTRRFPGFMRLYGALRSLKITGILRGLRGTERNYSVCGKAMVNSISDARNLFVVDDILNGPDCTVF